MEKTFGANWQEDLIDIFYIDLVEPNTTSIRRIQMGIRLPRLVPWNLLCVLIFSGRQGQRSFQASRDSFNAWVWAGINNFNALVWAGRNSFNACVCVGDI